MDNKDQEKIEEEVINQGSSPKEELKVKDNVRIILTHEDGTVVHDSTHNVVTTNGKAGIADQLLASPTLNKPTHMAIGSGVPGANALGTELARVALTSKTRSGAVVTLQGDFPAGTGTGALLEAGIADAGAAGNFYATTTYAVINKDPNMALTIIWTITVA
jgi:hypothetical protein